MARSNPVPRVGVQTATAKSWDVVDLRKDLGMTQETWQTTHPVDGVSRGLKTIQGLGCVESEHITDDDHINPIISDLAANKPLTNSSTMKRSTTRPSTSKVTHSSAPLPSRPRLGGTTIHAKLYSMARDKNWKPHLVEDKEDFRSNLRKASGLDRAYQQSLLAQKRDKRKAAPWGAGRLKVDAWEWRNPAKLVEKPRSSTRRATRGEGAIWERLHDRSGVIAQKKTNLYQQTLQVEREKRNRKAKDKMYNLAYSTFGEGRHNSGQHFHRVPTRDVSVSPAKEAPWERLFTKPTKKKKESSLRLTEQNPKPRFRAPPSNCIKEKARPPRPWHSHGRTTTRTDDGSTIDIGQWEESMYKDPLTNNYIKVKESDTRGQTPATAAEPAVFLQPEHLQPQDHTEVAEMLCDTQISISARRHYNGGNSEPDEKPVPGANSEAAISLLDLEAAEKARLLNEKRERQLAAQAARDAEAVNVKRRVEALESGRLPSPPHENTPVRKAPQRMTLNKRSAPPPKPTPQAFYADTESEDDLAA